MIRIAICDDDIKARHVLKFTLWKILPDDEKEQTIYEFSSGEKIIEWLEKNPSTLDVLFLDIEMDGINGMETAKEVREFDKDLIIVFVTGFADYVFDGYSVGALDYIIKPIREEKLRDVIKRINLHLYKTEEKVYTVENSDGFFRVPLHTILYFKSNAHKVTLYTNGKNYEFYGKLDKIQKNLDANFVRTHQRYLVNISNVKTIEESKLFISSATIPISRARKKDVLSAFTKNKLGDF